MSATLRERRAARTRSQIMDAALELFGKHGYEATTVDQIAERAEVGRRTFFHYFPNKESVLFGDLGLRGELMIQHLASRPPDEAPFTGLVAAVRVMMDVEFDLDRSIRIAEIVDANPALLQRSRTIVRNRFEGDVVEALRERYPDHPELELRVANGAAFGAVQAALAMHIMDPSVSLRTYFDQALGLLLDATAAFVEPGA